MHTIGLQIHSRGLKFGLYAGTNFPFKSLFTLLVNSRKACSCVMSRSSAGWFTTGTRITVGKKCPFLLYDP